MNRHFRNKIWRCQYLNSAISSSDRVSFPGHFRGGPIFYRLHVLIHKADLPERFIPSVLKNDDIAWFDIDAIRRLFISIPEMSNLFIRFVVRISVMENFLLDIGSGFDHLRQLPEIANSSVQIRHLSQPD
jgi:hypothetical protein